MPILQQYYTSYRNEVTGSAGFQIKASSPSIGQQLQQNIDGLIYYRVPPLLDTQPIETHPVALRYLYYGAGESILLCSQSSGSDNYGRPGNFFAHTVVMEPDLFVLDPILYWRSPFWQRADPEVRSQIDSLPVLQTFDAPSTVDIEGIWTFLEQENRREWLYKLLCAVIHYPRMLRRIVLLDSNENIAWWIIAVNQLLPPDYRRFLSFTTYSHNLETSPYLITGTTRDWFKDVEGSYQMYFVLNAEQGRCSQIEDSLYARRVMEAAYPDRLESDLLPLLVDYTRHFSPVTTIDQQLDMMMLYADMQRGRAGERLGTQELRAIRAALTTFEKLPVLEPEDVTELERLRDVVGDASNRQPPQELLPDYQRIDALLRRQPAREAERRDEIQGRVQAQYEPPVAQIPIQPQQNGALDYGVKIPDQPPQVQYNAMEIMPPVQNDEEMRAILEREAALNQEYMQKLQGSQQVDARQRVQNELQSFITGFSITDTEVARTQRFQQLRRQIDEAQLAEYVNQPVFIQCVMEVCKDEAVCFPLLCCFWQYFGSYLQPESVGQQIMIFSLNQMSRLGESGREQERVELFQALFSAIQGREQDWLRFIVSGNDQLSPEMAVKFYYQCVSRLAELDQRVPYRTMMLPLFEDLSELLKRELQYDIHYVGEHGEPREVLTEIEKWVRHARRNHYDAKALIDVGLNALKEMCSTQQWRDLARKILISDDLTPLPDNIEYQLVRIVLPAMSLSTFDPGKAEDIALCKKYWNYKGLSEDTRTTLAAILALQKDGVLDRVLAQRIQRQVKILLPDEYRLGTRRFMDMFLCREITADEHEYMIVAFFTRQFNYDASFWQAYQEVWQELFLQPEPAARDRAVQLLTFWFNASPEKFAEKSYIVQEFFLKLPAMFAPLSRKEVPVKRRDGVDNALEVFHELAQGQAWYAYLFPHNLNKQNGKQFMKVQPKVSKEQGFVTLLFELGAEKKNHRQSLNNQRIEDYAGFWQDYIRHFVDLIVNEPARALELLSFWFDESFEKLDRRDYLSQSFFFRLNQILRDAGRQDGFPAKAQEIETIVAKEPEKYPWYPLIRQYFVVPVPGNGNRT